MASSRALWGPRIPFYIHKIFLWALGRWYVNPCAMSRSVRVTWDPSIERRFCIYSRSISRRLLINIMQIIAKL